MKTPEFSTELNESEDDFSPLKQKGTIKNNVIIKLVEILLKCSKFFNLGQDKKKSSKIDSDSNESEDDLILPEKKKSIILYLYI